MDDLKPWHIVLIIAAVGVLGFSVFRFGIGSSPEAQMADSITMVDVETGQLYNFSLKGRRGVLVPGKNPETGKFTLMPVYQDDNDDWIVGQRDLDAMQYLEGTPSNVDRATGRATTNGESAVTVSN